MVELLGVGAAGRGIQTRRQVILQVTGKQNAGGLEIITVAQQDFTCRGKADMKHSFIKTGADYSSLLAQIRRICYIARLFNRSVSL